MLTKLRQIADPGAPGPFPGDRGGSLPDTARAVVTAFARVT